jgi:hypothetical protein
METDLKKYIELIDETRWGSLDDVKFEQEVGVSLRTHHQVTKDQLHGMVDWKYSDKPYYIKRVNKILKDVEDEEIREVTKFALQMTLDNYKIKLLCTIPGVGPTLASIILAFYDPYNYGVFDQSIWDQLFKEEKRNMTVEGYLKTLDELRDLAKKYQVPVRIIDMALRTKDMLDNS